MRLSDCRVGTSASKQREGMKMPSQNALICPHFLLKNDGLILSLMQLIHMDTSIKKEEFPNKKACCVAVSGSIATFVGSAEPGEGILSSPAAWGGLRPQSAQRISCS